VLHIDGYDGDIYADGSDQWPRLQVNIHGDGDAGDVECSDH